MNNRSLHKQKLGLLIGTLLFFALILWPSPEGLSPTAQRLAALIALMSCWWITEAVPIAITAMLPLVLFPLLGILSTTATAVNYSNHLIFLFLGGFFLAIAIEKSNLHKRVALFIILKMGTKPSRVLLGFILATALLAMWISNTATAMMLLPVGMAVVIQLSKGAQYEGRNGSEVEDFVRRNFGSLLMLSIAYGASIGGIGTLIGTPPNIIFAGYIKTNFPLSPDITFVRWMVAALPIVVLFIPIAWFVLTRFLSGFDLKKLRFQTSDGGGVLGEELNRLGPWSPDEKRVAWIFLITVLLWVFREPLSIQSLEIPGWALFFPMDQRGFFTDGTVAMFSAILLFLLPSYKNKGRALLHWREDIIKIPWEVVFLFGGGFALAAGFKESGLDFWLGGHLNLLSALPVLLLLFLLVMGVCHLTEVTSNTAVTTMILPVLASSAISLGQNPLFLMIPAVIAASMAFMLPVATPPNAIVFSSGWLKISTMAKAGVALNISGCFLLTLVGYYWIRFVFSIELGVLPSWTIP